MKSPVKRGGEQQRLSSDPSYFLRAENTEFEGRFTRGKAKLSYRAKLRLAQPEKGSNRGKTRKPRKISVVTWAEPEDGKEDQFDSLDQPAVYHGVCPKTASISAQALNKMAAAAGRREGETDADWGTRLVALEELREGVNNVMKSAVHDEDEVDFMTAYRISVRAALRDTDKNRATKASKLSMQSWTD